MQKAFERAGRICKGEGFGKGVLAAAGHGETEAEGKYRRELSIKKCQGSQRRKRANSRREFTDEK